MSDSQKSYSENYYLNLWEQFMDLQDAFQTCGPNKLEENYAEIRNLKRLIISAIAECNANSDKKPELARVNNALKLLLDEFINWYKSLPGVIEPPQTTLPLQNK